MENSIFEELYEEDYKRVDVKYNKVLNAYTHESNEKTGNFYIDDDNNFYPSGNILDEDNKEYYEQFFDFDIEELSNISKEDIEIEPAKITNGSIEKGKIKLKEKEEVIEETQTEKIVEEPIQENNEELEKLRKETLEMLDNITVIKKEEKENYKETILNAPNKDSLNICITTLKGLTDANIKAEFGDTPKQTIEEVKNIFDKSKENTTQEIINFDEFVSAINKNEEIDKEVTELLNKKTNLTKELETLKEKYNKALRNGYNGMFKQGENTTDILPQIKEIEQQLNDIEIEITNITNEKTDLGKYTEIINNSNLPKELKEQLIEKLNLYASVSKEKEGLEITKNEKLEELKEINKRYNEAVRRASLLLPGENTAELFQQKKSLEEEIKTIEEELLSKENALKEIEDFIKENNKVIQNHEYNDREEIINTIKGIVSTIDLNAPAEEINQKLDEIEKYLIKLNKIDKKTFEDKYNNAKTDEEKQQLITERENQVESYRDLLKHENKEIEDLLSERFNPLIDKFKSEIINKTKDNPEIPKEDPTKETEEPQQEIPKKGRLKVIATKALKWMKEHKLATVAIGLALTTGIMFAIPTTHMMINSALWSVGTKLGWSASTLGKLHSINLGLSKSVASGAYAFEGMSGAYTLGGAAGAQALYGAGTANLIGAITGLTGLGAIGTFGTSIINKIKNRNKKKEEPQQEIPVEKPIEEQVEVIEEEKDKEKEKEIENEKSTQLTEKQIEEMINKAVEKAVEQKNEEISKLTAEITAVKEDKKELEQLLKETRKQLEMSKQQGLSTEELEEEQGMKLS